MLHVHGNGRVGVSQGRYRDETWVLVNQNDGFSKFSDLSDDRVRDRLSAAAGSAALEQDVVRFFDDQRMFERLPIRLGQAPVVDPKQQGFDDERLVRVRERVELKNDVPFKESGQVRLNAGVHDATHVTEAQGLDASHGRVHPQSFSALHGMLVKPGQHVVECRILPDLTVVDAKLRIDRVERLLEKEHDPLAQVVRMSDDFDELLEPGSGVSSIRGDERVEREGGYGTADREHVDLVVADGQQVAVVPLPVKDKEWLSLVEKRVDDSEDRVGLPRAGTAEDGDVLDTLVLAQPERVLQLAIVFDRAKPVVTCCNITGRHGEMRLWFGDIRA